jgi:hypothetical protein
VAGFYDLVWCYAMRLVRAARQGDHCPMPALLQDFLCLRGGVVLRKPESIALRTCPWPRMSWLSRGGVATYPLLIRRPGKILLHHAGTEAGG